MRRALRLGPSVFAAALLVPLASPPARGQEPPRKAQRPAARTEREDEAPSENRIAYAKPSEELARLQSFVGVWRGEETWTDPGRYKRGEYEGFPGAEGYLTRSLERGPGDLSFVFRDDGRGPMGGVQGSGMISWDPVTRVYMLDAISSVFPGVLRLTGRFEGEDLVLSGEDTVTGKKRPVRLVVKGLGPDGWTETLSARERGRWGPVVTRRFAKAPPAAAR